MIKIDPASYPDVLPLVEADERGAVYPLSVLQSKQAGDVFREGGAYLIWHCSGFAYLYGDCLGSFLERIYRDYLAPGGTVVVNKERIPSMTVLTGAEKYPAEILPSLEANAGKVIALDASRMAEELGTVKAANVILLGALIKAMGLDDIDWETIVRNNVKAKFADLNADALKKGMEAAEL